LAAVEGAEVQMALITIFEPSFMRITAFRMDMCTYGSIFQNRASEISAAAHSITEAAIMKS
jgi:hypothetical protein